MNKTITTLFAAIGIAASAPASAIVVGGIDFGAMGADPSRTHLETATLAQTFINGNGQDAQAYGFVTTINGLNASDYSVAGGASGLYYVANFLDTQNVAPGYVEFGAANITVFYYDGSLGALNLLNNDSPTNISMFQTNGAFTTWLTLDGHGNLGGAAAPDAVVNGNGVLFTGSTLSGAGFGLFDVNPAGPGNAAAIAFLNSDGITDAVGNTTDMAIATGFNNFVLNPRDVANGFATGCANGTAAVGAWCFQGTASLRGSTEIPEPGMLALVGIGLLGLGAAARRRKA